MHGDKHRKLTIGDLSGRSGVASSLKDIRSALESLPEGRKKDWAFTCFHGSACYASRSLLRLSDFFGKNLRQVQLPPTGVTP